MVSPELQCPRNSSRRRSGTLTRSTSEGCRKSLAARRKTPRWRVGLVIRATDAMAVGRRVPSFLVEISEKTPFFRWGFRCAGSPTSCVEMLHRVRFRTPFAIGLSADSGAGKLNSRAIGSTETWTDQEGHARQIAARDLQR